MIVEYHRPTSIDEALNLLAREQPPSFALGGGTVINQATEQKIAVIDLQALGLDTITMKGDQLTVGATATLQDLMDFEGLPLELHKVIELEATYNLRQMATLAGTLVAANGRSPLTASLLACDINIEIQELGKTPQMVKLGNWLPIRIESMAGKLVTLLKIPINIRVAYEYIARSPADQPIVCAVVAQWESGRTRLALGGWGNAPVLAMDGPTPDGIDSAARNAYSDAGDQWASADYRQEMAGVLALRSLHRLRAS